MSEERPPAVRTVDPPERVWVQLRRLLPLGDDDLGERSKSGVRLESEAPGLLREWLRREDCVARAGDLPPTDRG